MWNTLKYVALNRNLTSKAQGFVGCIANDWMKFKFSNGDCNARILELMQRVILRIIRQERSKDQKIKRKQYFYF